MWIFSNIFTKMYQKGMEWAQHKHAVYYLAIISFFESNFSLILPDVMLGPMALAHPHKALWYAWVTTLWTVIGGILAYSIGLWAFTPMVEPVINFFGMHESYEDISNILNNEVIYVVLFACLSPIPYKIFAFAAGSVEFNFPAFIVASFIDRGVRFYLIAIAMKWGGPRFEKQLMRYIEWIGWTIVSLIIVGYLIYRWLS